MNCFQDHKAKQAKKRSLEIDKKLEQWGPEMTRKLNMVLIGTKGSGKSTLMKQIQLVTDDLSQEERISCTPLIRDKLVESMKSQIEETNMLDRLSGDVSLKKYAETVLNLPQDSLHTDISPELRDAIAGLWNDKAVRDAFDKFDGQFRQRYDLDALKFYLDSVTRIAAEDYVPTDEDVLRLYCPTKGIDQLIYEYGWPFVVTEVGEMSSAHPKKWIHQFDNVRLLIFMAPISDYIHGRTEGNSTSRLDQSLEMFRSLISTGWFSHLPIMLILTGMDVLIERLESNPLERFYPDFTGGADWREASKFLSNEFIKDLPSDHKVYEYFVNTLDTSQMRFIGAVMNDYVIPSQANIMPL